MKKILATVLMICALGVLDAGAQRFDRGYENFPTGEFIPKGTWAIGGNISYTQHLNDSYKFLIIENINSNGYNVAVNPMFLYMFKTNMGIGARFSYDRGLLDFENAEANVADISLAVRNYYKVSQNFAGSLVYRLYIPLGNAQRIAMFAEAQMGGSGGVAKILDAHSEDVKGTYQNVYSMRLGVNPGILAFLADNVALEASLGIVGVSYSWTDQNHNQVELGDRSSFGAGLVLNPLKLSIGVSIYL